MAKDVLLEIGTEELPAEFISLGMEQLKRLVEGELTKEKIPFQKIETYSTPCRLILWIIGVGEKQITETKEIRGPAERVAFDGEGKPTAQAIGFAKAQGVKVPGLVLKECDGRKYLFAVYKGKAQSSKKILKQMLPVIIKSITFPKMMRWNAKGVSFARPVRWILALWDNEVIKFDFGGIKSSQYSFGHRYLNPASFKVKDAKSFRAELKRHHCLIDPEERVNIIETKSSSLVKKFGGEIYADRKILDEISNLVEYPLCLLGKFSPSYLKIPQEILVDVMKVQEKCLPVKEKNEKLLPYFVIVANRKEDKGGIIRKGYERVMEARFKDAQFFYREDLDEPLIKKVEGLKGMILQQKLGTLFDKVERLIKLADFFDLNQESLEDFKLASKLCKADLLTEVVGEFPDLQGIMGRHYASLSSVKKVVCEAIFEHYLPRFPGDILPQTELGALLSIADRIDTLVGYFHLGLLPSGSEDPYSLRRQTNGLLEIILKFRFSINLERLIDKSAHLYGFERIQELKKVLLDFLRQRISYTLGQKGFQSDFVEAVLATGYLEIDKVADKIKALMNFSEKKDFLPFLKAYQRLNNILKSVPGEKFKKENIDEVLIREKAERELYHIYLKVEKSDFGTSEESLSTLSQFIFPINVFFKEVMVMAPEENLRVNRLMLLDRIRTLFLNFADFSLIKQNN